VVPHIYVVRINNLDDRNTLKEELLKRGIQVGIHYKPNHKLEYFKTGEKIILPVTDKVYSEVISLPIHPDLDLKDIEYVAKTLIKILPKYLK
jgi:dTDP-4-amino-4,6-dideoxygalactose transaminase